MYARRKRVCGHRGLELRLKWQVSPGRKQPASLRGTLEPASVMWETAMTSSRPQTARGASGSAWAMLPLPARERQQAGSGSLRNGSIPRKWWVLSWGMETSLISRRWYASSGTAGRLWMRPAASIST